jgi:hypothetical protein
MNKPASKSQLWALFCATKVDHRNDNLTYEQASQMIQASVDAAAARVDGAKKIIEDAIAAGTAKMREATPVPMVVSDQQQGKQYFVEGGVCGFAWVWMPYKKGNVKFINTLKKLGIAGDTYNHLIKKDTYRGGYQMWVSGGGQSMQLKEAFAQGFADVLGKNGIVAYVQSRMD